MRRFSLLYEALDQTTKTSEKTAALIEYFQSVSSTDASWAVALLTGRRIKRLVKTPLLRRWAAEEAGVEDWLFDESYDAVGDLAETIALVVPEPAAPSPAAEQEGLAWWIEEQLLPLRGADEVQQREAITDFWRQTRGTMRFVLMKVITGEFRVGVSQRLVVRALAKASGLSAETIAHRLMGDWQPSATFYEALVHPDAADALQSQPYPFCLAHPIQGDPEALCGSAEAWACEWKWDGIRGQLLRRSGETYLWSRGEDLQQGRWPEIETAAASLPDGTVLDGEVIGYADQSVLPFADLQRRIGRKTIGKKLLAEVPVVFFAFDQLEAEGTDIRGLDWQQRRGRLEATIAAAGEGALRLSPLVDIDNWDAATQVRSRSREMNAEGLMLKRRDASYAVGRVRGVWWKWKIEPFNVDAVLIYAQRGHGRRASLYTDYTFAVWDQGALVPFAKAYSGLTDAEIQQVDRFVRTHTLQKFGPVRQVAPELVMELAFEGIQKSNRHKSGIAVRFPRISRWRQDKRIEDAGTLDELRAMAAAANGAR